jgi:hypothetical protein
MAGGLVGENPGLLGCVSAPPGSDVPVRTSASPTYGEQKIRRRAPTCETAPQVVCSIE